MSRVVYLRWRTGVDVDEWSVSGVEVYGRVTSIPESYLRLPLSLKVGIVIRRRSDRKDPSGTYPTRTPTPTTT